MPQVETRNITLEYYHDECKPTKNAEHNTLRVTTLETLKFPDISLTTCGTYAHVKWYS